MEGWIGSFISPWVPIVMMMLSFGIVFLLLQRAEGKLQNGKRSPFPQEFLRGPGHSLYVKIENLRLDFMGWLMGAILMPVTLLLVPLSQAYFSGKTVSQTMWVLMAFVWMGGTIWIARKAVDTFKTVRQLRLGYEGEVGVGQELNQLMLSGYRVYHDFPAQQFNIDHIVIGQTGVFAVETKARSKPVTGRGKLDATVVCNGSELVFPNWTDRDSIEQAQRQSIWLSQWLTSAVGEKVPVKPALVIPGWFVERKKIGDVLVFNAKESKQAIARYHGSQLPAAMVQRIAHQVEAQCRDVAPKGHSKTNAQKN